MKIAIPVAHYHEGTTGEYVAKAFQKLDHEVSIISKSDFEKLFLARKEDQFDLYFCVDSGEPLDFSVIPADTTAKVAMWFIDYRHNKRRSTRIPADEQNALILLSRGGYVLQAQIEDVDDILTLVPQYKEKVMWLPVAADLDVWSDSPLQNEKIYDVGFVGNLWDASRASILQTLQQSGIKVGFKGHGACWKESAASLLRASKVGFNVSSFYETSAAFDLNMRFFETLSCGIPLITNSVPSITKIGASTLGCIKQYDSREMLYKMIPHWLGDESFLSSGHEGRLWIETAHTYVHRAKAALLWLDVD